MIYRLVDPWVADIASIIIEIYDLQISSIELLQSLHDPSNVHSRNVNFHMYINSLSNISDLEILRDLCYNKSRGNKSKVLIRFRKWCKLMIHIISAVLINDIHYNHISNTFFYIR